MRVISYSSHSREMMPSYSAWSDAFFSSSRASSRPAVSHRAVISFSSARRAAVFASQALRACVFCSISAPSAAACAA